MTKGGHLSIAKLANHNFDMLVDRADFASAVTEYAKDFQLSDCAELVELPDRLR